MSDRQAQETLDDGNIQELFRAIDDKDVAKFATFLAPRISFRFANAEPVTGKSAVTRAVAGFFDSIHALSHEIDRTIRQGRYVICEGRVIYTRHDASLLKVPFLNLFDIDNGLIEDYRIYVDASALYGG